MAHEDQKENKDYKNPLEGSQKDSLLLNKEVLEKLDEIVEQNKKIISSTSYSERRLRNRRIFITIKWSLLVVVVILGLISYKTIFDYTRNNVDNLETYILNLVKYTGDAAGN